MKARTALMIAWALFAATVVLIVVAFALLARPAAARSDDVPIAGFACQNGICVTSEAQIENLMKLWYAMQQRLLQCPRGAREI